MFSNKNLNQNMPKNVLVLKKM